MQPVQVVELVQLSAPDSQGLQKAQVGCLGPTRVENHGAWFWGVTHSGRASASSESAGFSGSWLFCPRDRVVVLAFRLAGGPSWDDADWED